ncbi:hypothetical protein JXA56_04180 [Candidatus Micrarchaeota archaeon]|nr:hypothetical protein [Candidatus Micrarchaeota archaeon]
MILYMIHESIAKYAEFRITHTYDYFKHKMPTQEPAQLRMNVYRSMFNYNSSIEGIIELLGMLADFKGNDAAKLLTYHYARACTHESECNNTLRAVILDALGRSTSDYALKSLLQYAKYAENERTVSRIVAALLKWEGKIDALKINAREKGKVRKMLHEVITKEVGGTHYG